MIIQLTSYETAQSVVLRTTVLYTCIKMRDDAIVMYIHCVSLDQAKRLFATLQELCGQSALGLSFNENEWVITINLEVISDFGIAFQ